MKRHSRRCGKETGNFRRNAGQGGGAHWHGYSSTQDERGRTTQLGLTLFTPHQQPGNNIYSLIPCVPQYLTPRTAPIQQNPLGERWENVHAIPHLLYSLLSLSPRPHNRIKMPNASSNITPPTTQHNLRQHRNTRPGNSHRIITRQDMLTTVTTAATPAGALGHLVFMCFIEIGHMVIPSCCVCAWRLSWLHVTRKSQPNTGK